MKLSRFYVKTIILSLKLKWKRFDSPYFPGLTEKVWFNQEVPGITSCESFVTSNRSVPGIGKITHPRTKTRIVISDNSCFWPEDFGFVCTQLLGVAFSPNPQKESLALLGVFQHLKLNFLAFLGP